MTRVLLGPLAALLALTLLAAPARAETPPPLLWQLPAEEESTGSGAGQIQHANAVAASNETGHVYVAVYDARIGGGFAPPPAPPGECVGEACQAPGSVLAQPVPDSAAPKPQGNPVRSPRCPKGRRAVRRHGKRVCIKKKHGSRLGKGGGRRGKGGRR